MCFPFCVALENFISRTFILLLAQGGLWFQGCRGLLLDVVLKWSGASVLLKMTSKGRKQSLQKGVESGLCHDTHQNITALKNQWLRSKNRKDKKFTFRESWRTLEDFLRNPIFSPCVCVTNTLHLHKQIKGHASFGVFLWEAFSISGVRWRTSTLIDSTLEVRMDS